MTFTVVKQINTRNRRLLVGTPITVADLDGPLTMEDWVRVGYVKDDSATESPVEPAAEQAPAAPTEEVHAEAPVVDEHHADGLQT